MHMKRTLSLILLSATLSLNSCVKEAVQGCPYTESTASATTAERSFINDYLLTNSLTATELSSGVSYIITRTGSGATPNVCSQVYVKYAGYLLGSTTAFDANNTEGGIPLALGGLIVGWQKGLAVLKSGGAITLFIPPSLGYGSQEIRDGNGNTVIPANSYLKFDIELFNVL